MLEFLESADDVIAIKIGGKLTRAELEETTRRVEQSLQENETTHIFVEIDDYSGFELDALREYLPRAIRMLSKLGRFGRVAVVADQRWVRWATRLESALLPHITYETFTSDQRVQALDWVEGRRERPRSPAIRIIETDVPNVIGFELDGKIAADELEAAAAYFNEAMDQEAPLRLLGRVKRLEGLEPGGLLNSDYFRMKMRALERVERYALVGGPAWLRGWVTLVGPLVKMEVRHFAPEEEDLAWSWLGARPKAERALAA